MVGCFVVKRQRFNSNLGPFNCSLKYLNKCKIPFSFLPKFASFSCFFMNYAFNEYSIIISSSHLNGKEDFGYFEKFIHTSNLEKGLKFMYKW